ncbi:SAM-dependent methyltransferase [Caldanaerobius fijiensis DSM 17918]|uniref:SAM-dependent methyltransferase n=1 Tax=Caldanaerobius fijiensis DSM 17918 TaxID=1121256 RepID=A0A1M4XY57_9THEO|nr:class I SAM-dependent rRNA methyltransferase [Caldanaerobius fijiensis]SHE98370.1 SAM-dependent methyltransferase [Caldanaerobius fijiensis DSM 17918]
MATVILNRKTPDRTVLGHPWIYRTEIDRIEGEYKPGDIVDVIDKNKRFIGKGYINLKSMISIRLLTRKDEKIDEEFFRKRISDAWEYRKKVMDDLNSCRIIYGESDFLPALVVDKFGDYLVAQFLSLGMDIRKDMIVTLLEEIIKPKGIFERDDVPVREIEGLEQKKGYLRGFFEPIQVFTENNLRFYVDIQNGQKTGYFLDQKENRVSIAKYVKGARVLDCFCHTGSFAVHAAHYGAKEITAVDISDDALAMAEKNARLNSLEDRISFVCANVFDLLRQYVSQGKSYDVVILDPPAFTKSKNTVDSAIKGYKEINLRALKLINPGGFLITASCSQHISPELFRNVILDAAVDAKRCIRLVEERSQAKDHPILPGVPETRYLKFLIFQVL